MDLPFDRDEYDLVRGPVVDAFEYDRGGIKVLIDKVFLDTLCRNHNNKFSRTGDLSPLVIGHTIDGAKEHDQPQKVGYLHNWATEPWVNDKGERTHAAYADHYVKKDNTLVVGGATLKLSSKEVLERWPRRSGEVWFGAKEIDPHCLLGATAPERNLGLLRLEANGDSCYTYESPGRLGTKPARLQMQEDPNAAAAELPIVKTMEGLVQQQMQSIQAIQAAGEMITQAVQALQAAIQVMQAPPQQPGAELGGGNEADFEQLLHQLGIQGGGGGDQGDQGGDPDQAPAQAPAPAPAPAKMARPSKDSIKVKELERELAVIRLSKRIDTIRTEKGLDITADADLIEDLLSMPVDMQERQFARLEKGPKVAGYAPPSLDAAIQSEVQVKKKVTSVEERQEVVKLSREKKIPYEQAAAELGYTPGL